MSDDLLKLKEILNQALQQLEDLTRTQDLVSYAPISNLSLIVKKKRRQQNLTQEMLGNLSGTSLNVVKRIESNKSITSSNLTAVLNALGMTLWIK